MPALESNRWDYGMATMSWSPWPNDRVVVDMVAGKVSRRMNEWTIHFYRAVPCRAGNKSESRRRATAQWRSRQRRVQMDKICRGFGRINWREGRGAKWKARPLEITHSFASGGRLTRWWNDLQKFPSVRTFLPPYTRTFILSHELQANFRRAISKVRKDEGLF